MELEFASVLFGSAVGAILPYVAVAASDWLKLKREQP